MREIDPANVPVELHYLIPYAEKWGINDSKALTVALNDAPIAEIEELNAVVSPVLMDIVKALTFPPLENTPDATVFVALMMAAGGARGILNELRWRDKPKDKPKSHEDDDFWGNPPHQMGKEWLASMGWPEKFPSPNIDPANVPLELHPLIPYAEKWGITNRRVLRAVLNEAPLEELEGLYKVLQSASDDIFRFSLLHRPENAPISYETGIFEVLWTVFGEVSSILSSALPTEQLLKLYGWPERFPGPKLDPSKFPPELLPIVPHAEKWVLEDDAIRSMVIEIAPDEELEEFMQAVNQVGTRQISRLALKMTYDETRKSEAFILLTLLELAQEAESHLRTRKYSPPMDNVQSE
jgi:hypothetical protein